MASGDLLHLRSGAASATVDAGVGARLAGLTVEGLSLVRRDEPSAYGWGVYPMLPWAGRLRENRFSFAGQVHPLPATYEGWALHGTVLDVPWQVEEAGEGRAVLSAPLGPGWPWEGRARQIWELTEDGLAATMEVHSARDPFPASLGWHPWFERRLSRGGDVEIDLPADGMLERGPDYLPTGRVLRPVPRPLTGAYDDAFATPARRATLTWPGALRLEIGSDCDWTVVFSMRPGGVCVEPQTAPPDAFNRDGSALVVAPGAPLTARMDWRWSLPATS